MFEAPRNIRAATAEPGNFAVGFAPLSQIDFNKIWSVIWRGRATIAFTTLVALALAALFIVLAPREYTAVTQILIDPTDLRAVGNETTQAKCTGRRVVQGEARAHAAIRGLSTP